MKKIIISLAMVAIVAISFTPIAGATSTTYTDHNKHEPCDTVDADGNMDDLCPPTTTTTLPHHPTTTTTIPHHVPTTTTIPNIVPTTSSTVPSVAPTTPPNGNPPEMPRTGTDVEKLGVAAIVATLLGFFMMTRKRRPLS